MVHPLLSAARQDDLPQVKFLLTLAPSGSRIGRALVLALEREHLQAANLLAHHGARHSEIGWKVWRRVCKQRHLIGIRYLLGILPDHPGHLGKADHVFYGLLACYDPESQEQKIVQRCVRKLGSPLYELADDQGRLRHGLTEDTLRAWIAVPPLGVLLHQRELFEIACGNPCLGLLQAIIEAIIEAAPHPSDDSYPSCSLGFWQACRMGYLPVVRTILDSLQVTRGDLWMGLEMACLGGDLGTVRCLIDHGAPVEELERRTLKLTLKPGRRQLIQYLLDQGAKFDGYQVLLNACEDGDLERAKDLIAQEMCPGEDYGELLLAASDGNQAEMVQYLIDRGADFEGHDRQMFAEACEHGRLEIVQLLTSHQITPMGELYCWDPKAFMTACRQGHLEIIRHLAREVNPNQTPDTYDLVGALAEACDREDIPVIQCLLDSGLEEETVRWAMEEYPEMEEILGRHIYQRRAKSARSVSAH